MNAPRLDMDEFVAEARELLAQFEEAAVRLRSSADPVEAATAAFRAMHTIKGNSRLFGLKVVERSAHAVEETLERIREQPQTSARSADALLAASDFIASLLDDVRRSNEVDPTPLLELLGNLTAVERPSVVRRTWSTERLIAPTPVAWIHSLTRSGSVRGGKLTTPDGGIDDPLSRGDATIETTILTDQVLADAVPLGEKESPAAPKRPPAECVLTVDFAGPGLAPVPFAVRLARSATVLGGSLDAGQESLDEPLQPQRLVATIRASSDLSQRELQKALGLSVEAPRPKEAEPARQEPVGAAPAAAPAPTVVESTPRDAALPTRDLEKSTSVRVHTNLLDRLMDLAGELVIVRNQAIASVDADDGRFRPMFLQLHSVVRDLQEVVMRTRMQPIASLFRRFPRLVRDLARQLDKDIELTLVGEEVELDRSVLEALADPLVHLVRNAVDHGIETPTRRIEAGKPPVGNIRLSARPESGRIHVEIADDGAGVDPQAVRRKALALGLRSAAELERMSMDELVELILLPGFSTARAVTDVSGRGVGMDVVKTNLEQLGGRLEIHSTPGAGMRVELELPLTLAIVPCLLVSSGGRRYAIPQKDVEEVVCLHPELNAGKIELGVDQEVYRLRGKLLPLVRLREVLSRPVRFDAAVRSEILRKAAVESSQSTTTTFVVARHGARRFGMIVDGVLGSEEVVLKPMQSFLKPLACFAGATVMGDGNVVLVLDAAGVARHAGLSAGAAESSEPARRRQSDYETQPFLLFTYGPDEQFAVPLQDVRRLDRVDADKIERVGGEEFVVLDDKPVRLLRLQERLPVSKPAESPKELFVVIPRRSTTPIGLAATRILDAEQMVPRLESTGVHGRGVLGVAMIRERLTYVLVLHELLEQAEQAPQEGSRILVVDDSEFFRRLVSSYLRGAGYLVETASNGAEGLEKLKAGRFDLAVSDVEMPVMDGYGFARGVRSEGRFAGLPLLALTSLASEADRNRALAAGFSRHQVKLDRDRLLHDVEELLSRREGGAA